MPCRVTSSAMVATMRVSADASRSRCITRTWNTMPTPPTRRIPGSIASGHGHPVFDVELEVDVGPDHADRALGEVHDPGAPIDQHQADRGQRVETARSDAEGAEADQFFAHGNPPRPGVRQPSFTASRTGRSEKKSSDKRTGAPSSIW